MEVDSLSFDDVHCNPRGRGREVCEVRYGISGSRERFVVEIPKEDIPGVDNLAKELNLLEIVESSGGKIYSNTGPLLEQLGAEKEKRFVKRVK
jgi:hypothetical protein